MTFVSTLGQTLDQIDRLKGLNLQVATFQTQLASGKKTTLFKGLGTDVITSEKSRANFNLLETYSANITTASRRIKMMSTALDNISEQAANVVNGIQIQTQKGEIEIDSLRNLAGNALEFITSLINEQDGDRYVFAGSDTLNAPLNDTGAHDTYLQTQINNWVNGTIDTDQLMDSYRDRTQLNDTTIGYSAQLSSGETKNVFVRVDETTELDYTVRANDEGLRDIVVAINMLKKVTETLDVVSLDADSPPGTVSAPGATQDEQNDNFATMFNDIASMITRALDKVEVLEYGLGNVHAQITQIEVNYKQEKNFLLDNIAKVEDVDINEVAVKLNALQTQLEASYRVTAMVQGLSLANFLP